MNNIKEKDYTNYLSKSYQSLKQQYGNRFWGHSFLLMLISWVPFIGTMMTSGYAYSLENNKVDLNKIFKKGAYAFIPLFVLELILGLISGFISGILSVFPFIGMLAIFTGYISIVLSIPIYSLGYKASKYYDIGSGFDISHIKNIMTYNKHSKKSLLMNSLYYYLIVFVFILITFFIIFAALIPIIASGALFSGIIPLEYSSTLNYSDADIAALISICIQALPFIFTILMITAYFMIILSIILYRASALFYEDMEKLVPTQQNINYTTTQSYTNMKPNVTQTNNTTQEESQYQPDDSIRTNKQDTPIINSEEEYKSQDDQNK